jgi:histidinol phosphatase-like enzyme (inositol monophosphatase family)
MLADMADRDRLDFMLQAVRQAGEITLRYFRSPFASDNKAFDAQDYDPVTRADLECEQFLRQAIFQRFPNDGILGEEEGLKQGRNDYCWVLDPIDGTRSFMAGLPTWGILVGLACQGRMVAGWLFQPFTGELFYADDRGAYLDHRETRSRLATRKTIHRLDEALLCTTDPSLFEPSQKLFYRAIEQKVRLKRYGTDCYGYAMLAAGQADVVVEAGLKPYDILPLIPIIEKAGGTVTDWQGKKLNIAHCLSNPQPLEILACANPDLFQAVQSTF